MKKLSFILFVTMLLVSCDGKISIETADAFKGEYWMETTTIKIVNGEELPTNGKSAWTPVSIYEKSGNLYVQTEMLGAPDTESEHPEEIDASWERPDFILQRKVFAEKGEEEPSDGLEEINTTDNAVIRIMNGYIIATNRGVLAKSLPIKVKSGSKTILNLEPYKKMDVQVSSSDGETIQTVKTWYEYGPMVMENEIITWQVELVLDGYVYSSNVQKFDHIIHKNTLYKR